MSVKTVAVSKSFTFHAAHHDEEATDQCGQTHGHTYHLEVKVYGELSGHRMLLHGNVLKDYYRGYVEPYVEHRNLNETCPVNPTMENMVMWLADLFAKELRRVPAVTQVRVRLWETPTMYAETKRNCF